MSKIDYSTFRAKTEDLNISDEELREYFTELEDVDDTGTESFGPVIGIDEDRVDLKDDPIASTQAAGLFNLVNSLARRRRYKKFKRALKEHSDRPVLVSEGDSWFQYPFKLDDVIDHLSRDFNVYSVGAAGDTTENMVFKSPEYLTAIEQAQQESGKAPAGFIFSSGGNDLLGKRGKTRVLQQIVRKHQSGESVSLDTAYVQDELDKTLGMLGSAYRHMLREVGAEFPDLPVFVHSYDRVFPFNSSNPADSHRKGKWVQPSLSKQGVTRFEDQRMITDDLIARFQALINTIATEHSNLRIIDTGQPLADNLELWHDEIHPTNEGYRIVAESFKQHIEQVIG